MPLVEKESFQLFCSYLEQVSKTKGVEEKLKIIEEYWKQVCNVTCLYDVPARMMEPFDSFSILRLLLPELDNERRSFGMKEKGLGELYISVFELERSSLDAQRLRRWQDPTLQQQPGQIPALPGNFFSVLEAVLRYRCSNASLCVTIAQVNEAV